MSTSPTRLWRIFENLENGNLTDAKRQARGLSTFRLSMYARQILGWEFSRAVVAAAYLKGEVSFQAYCDSKEVQS